MTILSRLRQRITDYWIELEFRDLEELKARRASIDARRLADLADEHKEHDRQLVLIHRQYDDEAIDLDHAITKTEIHLDRLAEDIKPAAKVLDFRHNKAA